MKTSIISALLWKDYRLIRLVMLSGIALILLSSIAPIGLAICLETGAEPGRKLGLAANCSFFLGGLVSGLLMPLVAGILCASEEADRSARFMATLPASRWSMLVSKATVGIGAVALVLALDFGMLSILPEHRRPPDGEFTDVLILVGSTWWLMFGGAWLAGWACRSPAISTVIGIGMPIVLAVVIFNSQIPDWQPFYWGGAMATGTMCLLIGSALAVTRTGDN